MQPDWMMKALFYFIKFNFFFFLTRVSYLGINFFGGSGFLVGTCWFVLLPSPIICILIFWIHVTDQRPFHYDLGSHHLWSAGFVLDFLFYHPFFSCGDPERCSTSTISPSGLETQVSSQWLLPPPMSSIPSATGMQPGARKTSFPSVNLDHF